MRNGCEGWRFWAVSQPGLAADELTRLDRVVARRLDDIDSAEHAHGYHMRCTEHGRSGLSTIGM